MNINTHKQPTSPLLARGNHMALTHPASYPVAHPIPTYINNAITLYKLHQTDKTDETLSTHTTKTTLTYRNMSITCTETFNTLGCLFYVLLRIVHIFLCACLLRVVLAPLSLVGVCLVSLLLPWPSPRAYDDAQQLFHDPETKTQTNLHDHSNNYINNYIIQTSQN